MHILLGSINTFISIVIKTKSNYNSARNEKESLRVINEVCRESNI